jgi:L-threonylcarbamoyladenylate synthase
MFSEMPDKMMKQIKEGISILQKGGVIAFPTDTVYGLGASFDDIAAIERIFNLKRRQGDKGLPLLVADEQQMAEVVAFVPMLAEKLLKSFKTGRLTLVLEKADSVPDTVTGGRNTVAVRITAHPVAQALIKGLSKPLIATSANFSGQKSALTAAEVSRQFGDKVDLVIEDIGGNQGIASTIVDVSRGIPEVLRQGVINREEIEKVCQMG